MKEVLPELEAPLSQNSTICAWITTTGPLNVSIKKNETITSGSQCLLRKIDISLTEDKIRSFTHLIFYLEPYIRWKKQQLNLENLHENENSKESSTNEINRC